MEINRVFFFRRIEINSPLWCKLLKRTELRTEIWYMEIWLKHQLGAFSWVSIGFHISGHPKEFMVYSPIGE